MILTRSATKYPKYVCEFTGLPLIKGKPIVSMSSHGDDSADTFNQVTSEKWLVGGLGASIPYWSSAEGDLEPWISFDMGDTYFVKLVAFLQQPALTNVHLKAVEILIGNGPGLNKKTTCTYQQGNFEITRIYYVPCRNVVGFGTHLTFKAHTTGRIYISRVAAFGFPYDPSEWLVIKKPSL